MFITINPKIRLDLKSKFILNCLSNYGEFHIKIFEQSIISYTKPEINVLNTAVSYTFVSIDINNYKPATSYLKAHTISVYDRKGNLFNEYYSINQAKFALGLSENEIRWNRNRENHFIYCSKLNLDLRIDDETIQINSSETPLSNY